MPEDIYDSYLTLGAEGRHEIKIKGSRFIALGFPIDSETKALDILDRIRKTEHAASHHCFAYIAGLDTEKFKYSDDGEPSGTAGRPIYQAISGRGLKDVLVIVVRYYGGTKLGTGGLTRAYSQAATEMLDSTRIIEMLICDRLTLKVAFGYYDRIMRIINRGEHKIISQDFADRVKLEVEIRKSQTDGFESQLIELTGGQVEITKND
jgi:uncharacterized YigZ family protein